MFREISKPGKKRINIRLLSLSSLFITACAIVVYVLYTPPYPGVADQGDFQRVMGVSGLSAAADSDSHFFRYVIKEYDMTGINPLRLAGIIPTTSVIYPVAAAKLICRVSGTNVFNVQVLSVIYCLMYISSIILCLILLGIKKESLFIFCGFAALFILMDGNYLIWFNSLYGEPMMVIGLLIFAASCLYSINSENPGIKEVLFLFFTSVLFVGAKLQCISALPLVIFMILRIIYSKKEKIHMGKMRFQVILPVVFLVFYCGGIYIDLNKTCGMDTKYNSVFYGILKSSDNPEKDLETLGLSADLAVESGKHAYLPAEEYERYIPWSEVTEKEFYRKISNIKLLKFYILNPGRLIKGLEYTASQSFQTQSFLGKYEKGAVSGYTHQFNRFTFWSDFRNRYFPKRLSFIIVFTAAVLFVSFLKYMKHKSDFRCRLKIELFWVIAGISLLQFPMPYIGNGEADT
ncbi:MAG TPA: hypothetical protein VIL89_07575, partial [Clostridia bacterium]